MKHYIVYFINGSHKYVQSSLDLMENLDRLELVGINYEVVDYIVPLEKHIDQSIENFFLTETPYGKKKILLIKKSKK
jgi:hypothetical protein